MSGKILSIQKNSHIEIITVNLTKPDRVKSLRLLDEFVQLFIEIAWDKEVKVVILSIADEKPFSLDSVSGLYKEEEMEFWSLTEPVAKLDKPVIAVMNGNAIEQGLELALACDIRIATETAHFGLPQLKFGMIPWDGGTQRLARLLGRGKALEMVLTGETIDAKEAYRIGLVNKVVPPDKLMTVAMDVAKEMAARGPIALRYAKEAIYKGMDMTLKQGLRLEADLYLLLHTTKDRVEGIQAFREKRTPKFEGK